jgi:ABC-type sugar transport system substrate-binding protein
MRAYYIIIFIFLLFTVPGFTQSKTESGNRKFLIGFSQCTTADAWRRSMDQEMQNELLYYPDLQLLIKDAENNSKKQVNDIRELLAAGIASSVSYSRMLVNRTLLACHSLKSSRYPIR